MKKLLKLAVILVLFVLGVASVSAEDQPPLTMEVYTATGGNPIYFHFKSRSGTLNISASVPGQTRTFTITQDAGSTMTVTGGGSFVCNGTVIPLDVTVVWDGGKSWTMPRPACYMNETHTYTYGTATATSSNILATVPATLAVSAGTTDCQIESSGVKVHSTTTLENGNVIATIKTADNIVAYGKKDFGNNDVWLAVHIDRELGWVFSSAVTLHNCTVADLPKVAGPNVATPNEAAGDILLSPVYSFDSGVCTVGFTMAVEGITYDSQTYQVQEIQISKDTYVTAYTNEKVLIVMVKVTDRGCGTFGFENRQDR